MNDFAHIPDIGDRLLRRVGRLREEARLYARGAIVATSPEATNVMFATSHDYHAFADDLIEVLEKIGVYVHPELKKR